MGYSTFHLESQKGRIRWYSCLTPILTSQSLTKLLSLGNQVIKVYLISQYQYHRIVKMDMKNWRSYAKSKCFYRGVVIYIDKNLRRRMLIRDDLSLYPIRQKSVKNMNQYGAYVFWCLRIGMPLEIQDYIYIFGYMKS